MSTPAGPYSIGSDLLPGLSKIVEETGELNQVIGKLIGAGGEFNHWDGSDLRDRLHSELADVVAAVDFVIDNAGLDRAWINERVSQKRQRFQQWHDDAPRQ